MVCGGEAVGRLFGEPVMTLDVGSGNDPTDADVLCDIDVFGKSMQRSGLAFSRPSGKKVVCGDVQHLPFKDKGFDQVLARHVLEHVDDPSLACGELSRVGKAGEVICPLPFFEQAATGGWPGHKWYVWVRDGGPIFGETLCFERIRSFNYFEVCDCKEGAFVRRLLQLGVGDQLCNLLHGLRMENYDIPADWTFYRWEGQIDFEVKELVEDAGYSLYRVSA